VKSAESISRLFLLSLGLSEMKLLAVVSFSLYEKLEDRDKCIVPIDDLRIPLGFVDADAPPFSEENETSTGQVLVRKKAFGLNYRDLGIMELAWASLRDVSQDSYYPIGSDFAGYVETCGKEVMSLRIGDAVMGNCSYPFGENGGSPGIPSNHSSREYEVFHHGNLVKVPSYISTVEAAAMGIGVQTSTAMIRKAEIIEGNSVLVTSMTSNTAYFLLAALSNVNCDVYCLSYSGKNTESAKEIFPFIREIYSFKNNHVSDMPMFDVVLDAFSDTYLESLLPNLNFGSRYLTCGIFNQSGWKMENAKACSLSGLLASIIGKNINLIGNCLGSTKDLEDGLSVYRKHRINLGQVFTKSDSLEDFISKTYNFKNDKFGKVVYQF